MSKTPFNDKDIEEYGRISDRVKRELDSLDTLRTKDRDDVAMKTMADLLYLATYYKNDEDVQGAVRRMWHELLERGALVGE